MLEGVCNPSTKYLVEYHNTGFYLKCKNIDDDIGYVEICGYDCCIKSIEVVGNKHEVVNSRQFELTQLNLNTRGDCAEVVIKQTNGHLVFTGELKMNDKPLQYYQRGEVEDNLKEKLTKLSEEK